MALIRTAMLAVLLLACGAAARRLHSVQPLLLRLPSDASSSAHSGATEIQLPAQSLLAASDASLRQRQRNRPAHGSISGAGIGCAAISASANAARAVLRFASGLQPHKHSAARDAAAGGSDPQRAPLRRAGRRLAQNQGSRRCESGSGCVIAFSLLLAGALTFLVSALCCFCCCKRTSRPRPNANSIAATAAARAAAGDPAAAAAEIMEKQLVSKIGDAHPMAGVECPVCLDTPCELVLPCNHGCCHICLDKLITRAARLTLCPMCRERILPPTIEAVVVADPSSANGSAAAGGSNEVTSDASAADGADASRRGWRRLLPTPLPPREWVMVVWWRQRRQPRGNSAQPPAGQYLVGIPAHTGACP